MNQDHNNTEGGPGNELFPVFLKMQKLRLLIVGGGAVGFEKLQAVLQNAPDTLVRLVAIRISDQIRELAAKHSNIVLFERAYESSDLQNCDLVIVSVGNLIFSEIICVEARRAGKLINVADNPALCDFYLGSIVRKGDLKIAISTNGKSPTVAKRIKEALNEYIPGEINEVLNNMEVIRREMKGDFTEKVNKLNDITKVLAAKQIKHDGPTNTSERKWGGIVKWCLFAFFFMILGHTLFSLIPFRQIIREIPKLIEPKTFSLMLITGFMAQMVDGSLGLGYGTISTTFLLAIGVNPAIVSSRVHSARVFSSGVSGYSHHRFGNINKKLFMALVIPGIIGAIIGATLAYFGQKYATYIRIPLSFYTIYLGYFIIRKSRMKNQKSLKINSAGSLAWTGGFLDAFAGGGWGSLVTSTLISKRRSPRYVVGSVCLAEFFVVLASAFTFLVLLRHIPIFDILGLILGGVIAAPIAARLVGKLPVKTMFVLVGILVILTSLTTLFKAVMVLIHG